MILAYLDQVGFSPSQPVTASWTLPGRRTLIPYENPQGRRLNASAALVKHGPHPAFHWDAVPRTLTAEDVLVFIRHIPRPGGRPLVVVLDNASIHTSRVIRDALPELAAEGITLFYLPPYSPQLNAIEAYFRGVKHYDLPERTYTSLDDLGDAVDHAFERVEARLLSRPRSLSLPQESEHQPRRAA